MKLKNVDFTQNCPSKTYLLNADTDIYLYFNSLLKGFYIYVMHSGASGRLRTLVVLVWPKMKISLSHLSCLCFLFLTCIFFTTASLHRNHFSFSFFFFFSPKSGCFAGNFLDLLRNFVHHKLPLYPQKFTLFRLSRCDKRRFS